MTKQNILQVAKMETSLSYEYKTSRKTIDSFVESCLVNESDAQAFMMSASLYTIAGLAVKLVCISQKDKNKKSQKETLVDFIESTYSKANKQMPCERDINRKIQLARFVVNNNNYLKEFTTTPTQLIAEAIKIIKKYKSIRDLTESMQAANKGTPKQADSESVKLGKRIDALFKDIAKAENSDSYYRIIEAKLKEATATATAKKGAKKVA